MSEKYVYGERPAEVMTAAGVHGTLIRDLDGSFLFRVYHEDKSFTDYEIRHEDLSVTIAEDELASFYRIGEHLVLDHSPQVLGLTPVDDKG